MPEPAQASVVHRSKRPVCSVVSLCCPLLLLGLRLFLATPPGRHLTQQLFGRYYTAGTLFALGFYGAIGLGLALLGLNLGVIAFVRREKPLWVPGLAAALNVLAALAVLIFLRSG